MPASSIADSETRSVNSFASSFSQRSFFGKLNKYELKRRFYEKLDDFKNKVLLHKEQGFIVYRARCMYSGGVVVLKGYSRESLTLQTRQRVFSEVTLLQRAQCPFILKCFDAFEDQGWWWLVLENCAAGDLYRIVQSNGPIREEGWLVSQVLLPILQTLAYLHAEGVIHRDIKPEHVLFNSEKVAKLSGFFLSWDVNRYSYPKDMVGTLDYVAPEVFALNGPHAKQQAVMHYDYKVDIWGVGVMAYDVLAGSPPFAAEDPNATVEGILTREVEYPDFMSDDAVDFIDQCLTKDPARRPTARQLLTHPWVRSHLDWEPPEDWDDPIPSIDFSYYRVGGPGGASGAEGDFDDSDGEEEGRKWYNPMTWIKRRNSLEDLLANTDGDEGGGGRGGRGAWQLTHSIGNFARTLMGNKVAPEGSAAALGPGGGGGGPGVAGDKAFQLLPGRQRKELEGVPEGDEEGLDPESGPPGANGLPASPTANGQPPLGGPRPDSFSSATAAALAAPRPYSPPPLPVPPLNFGPGGGGGAGAKGGAGEEQQAGSVRSVDDSSRRGPGAAHFGSGKGLAAAAAAALAETGASGGGGGGAPTKAPAFLPHPAAPASPPDERSVGALGGGGAAAAAPAGTTGVAAPAAATMPPPPVPRRLQGAAATAAHDSAASSEMRHSGSSSGGSGSGGSKRSAMSPPPPASEISGGSIGRPTSAAAAAAAAAAATAAASTSRPASARPLSAVAARAAPSDATAAAAAAAAAGARPGTALDAASLLQLLPAEKLQLGLDDGAAGGSTTASGAAAADGGGAAGGPGAGGERLLPHLSSAVIHSGGEEEGQASGEAAPHATPPWVIPSASGHAAAAAASGATAAATEVEELVEDLDGPAAPTASTAAAAAAAASTPAAPAGDAGGSSGSGSGAPAVPPLAVAAPLHPVLPAGSSKTTPREREDAHRLTAGSGTGEE